MSHDSPQLFIALLHFPVYNKAREIVATSLTTLNLHDLARLTATYGTSGCYVVTPLQRQRELAHQMIAHWTQGYGATYNPTRAEALSICMWSNISKRSNRTSSDAAGWPRA